MVASLSPPSTTTLSNLAFPDALSDMVSTTRETLIFAACTISIATTVQSQPLDISSSGGEARAKISSSRDAGAQSKRRLRPLQKHINKDHDNLGKLANARQHKR